MCFREKANSIGRCPLNWANRADVIISIKDGGGLETFHNFTLNITTEAGQKPAGESRSEEAAERPAAEEGSNSKRRTHAAACCRRRANCPATRYILAARSSARYRFNGQAEAIRFSPDGKTLTVAFKCEGVAWIDMDTGRIESTKYPRLERFVVTGCAISPQGDKVAYCWHNGLLSTTSIRVSPNKPVVLQKQTPSILGFAQAAFSPDGKHFAAAKKPGRRGFGTWPTRNWGKRFWLQPTRRKGVTDFLSPTRLTASC